MQRPAYDENGEGDCIIKALERETATFADKTASRERRLDALRFVVHFAGDLSRLSTASILILRRSKIRQNYRVDASVS